MILEGRFIIHASQERVWDAIWDIPTLASWVPGCTSATELEDGTYRAHIDQQVGILKASFDLRLTVVESLPPHRIRLEGHGEDRRLRSNLQIETEVALVPEGTGTVLQYRHDLGIFGRLGALGYPVIQRRARELESEFARRATASLAGG